MQKELDTYKMRGLRSRLVVLLRNKGIHDERVLQAIGRVPRHLFLDKAFWEWAYKDQAFPIAADQTISQPFTVAFQSQLLQLAHSDNILEIGTGSGYQASILSLICKRVYSIERHEILFKISSERLFSMGFRNVRCYHGDGYAGLPGRAPFDKILVTCGAPDIPEDLLSQLAEGGKMVVPVGDGDRQRMLRITKQGDRYIKEDFGPCAFVPFLEGMSNQRVQGDQKSRVSL